MVCPHDFSNGLRCTGCGKTARQILVERGQLPERELRKEQEQNMDAMQQLIATVAQSVRNLPKPLRDKLNRDGGTVIIAAVASKEGGDDECLASHGFFAVAGDSSDERFRGQEGLLELIGARMVVIEDLVRSVAETGGIPADDVIERVRESLKEKGTRRTYEGN